MKTHWKVLFGFSVILNIVFIIGFVSVAHFGKNAIFNIITGNHYPMIILSPAGFRKWNETNNITKQEKRQQILKQKQIIQEIRINLMAGKISEQEFAIQMNKLHELQHSNFKLFVADFPKYWNSLSEKKRNKYIRHLRDYHHDDEDDWELED
ncbi:MAG: hypothetical protein ACPG8V_04150 [Alphaproteobacteria bacterium]